jgi:hypothetical protein
MTIRRTSRREPLERAIALIYLKRTADNASFRGGTGEMREGAGSSMQKLAINKIGVRGRFRKNLGDIVPLAASIEEVGSRLWCGQTGG